ncbi:MAG: hypothetical protein LBG15_14290 [Dysgonamonadaceae bacterium]|jgi:hypothetical protein|nr:hypothetical protein [Dysgonamonadaceae bacterium]
MKTLKILLFIMICTASYTGCSENQGISDNNAQDNGDVAVSDTAITLLDFVLPNDCNWLDLQSDSVYLFNSQQQLAPYIVGTVGIDFEKYSLLAVRGGATNGIRNIDERLQEISANEYQLNIDITLDDTTEAPIWTVSVLVSKISDEARIDLLVNINGKENISLTGTKWKLAALVDVQTRESIEPEPKECNKCYTLEFDSDTTAIGQSVVNTLHFIVTRSNMNMSLMTEMWDGDQGNVNLFYEALLTLDVYEYSKEELKIYYDERKKYLLYEQVRDSPEDDNVANTEENVTTSSINGQWKRIEENDAWDYNLIHPVDYYAVWEFFPDGTVKYYDNSDNTDERFKTYELKSDSLYIL